MLAFQEDLFIEHCKSSCCIPVSVIMSPLQTKDACLVSSRSLRLQFFNWFQEADESSENIADNAKLLDAQIACTDNTVGHMQNFAITVFICH